MDGILAGWHTNETIKDYWHILQCNMSYKLKMDIEIANMCLNNI